MIEEKEVHTEADTQESQESSAQTQSTHQTDSHYPQGYPDKQEYRSAGSTLLVILGIALILVGALILMPSLLGPFWAPIQALFSFAATLFWPLVLIVAGIFVIRLASKTSNEKGLPMRTSPSMPPAGTRLFRSSRNRMIGGVCGGIAEYFNMDPTLVRIITVLIFLLPGISWIAYILAWIIIPLDRS